MSHHVIYKCKSYNPVILSNTHLNWKCIFQSTHCPVAVLSCKSVSAIHPLSAWAHFRSLEKEGHLKSSCCDKPTDQAKGQSRQLITSIVERKHDWKWSWYEFGKLSRCSNRTEQSEKNKVGEEGPVQAPYTWFTNWVQGSKSADPHELLVHVNLFSAI